MTRAARRYGWVAAAAAALGLLAACGEQDRSATTDAVADRSLHSGIDTAGFDTGVRAQDDFFRHVNGSWLDRTEIPADKSNYGSFNMLADEAEADLHAIIEAAAASDAPAGTDMQKVGDFYASFMDEAKAEELGAKPLAPYLEKIAALESHDDVHALMAEFARIGVEIPFGGFVGADAKNSTQYALILWQNGLGMPDRDYYLSDDAKFAELRKAYAAHVADMLARTGHADAKAAADDILALETRIAQ